ncbi:glycoside hydrolase family 70 protein [Lactococcus nasutitermitis]|uniref:dextransucrase n=1 Tax=Lactococcus nasutitermitis TaxID=1652957 RepID=A0ABV9JCQ9_9LACT|nr:glycoside hydrolase family 70 protein [Lactococcus nasutitermitis]
MKKPHETKVRKLCYSAMTALLLFGGLSNVPAAFARTTTNPNAPSSTDNMNTIQGYLSYTGWYEPQQIHFGGTTWAKTSGDWRPYLMYTWPDLKTQIAYLEYFLENGYSNSANGLTLSLVQKLSSMTDTTAEQDAANNYAAIMRDNIEARITADNNAGQSGLGNLANTMSAFEATIPAFSSASEAPVEFSTSKTYAPVNVGYAAQDQFTFINSANTPGANSNYRVFSSDRGSEMLMGNDIDNSNPTVQAENLNWEYFLLNYGKIMDGNTNANFDGFRIDATDDYSNDVLAQEGQLMNALYGTANNPAAANAHLTYDEGYSSKDQSYESSVDNQQLAMDAAYYYTLRGVLQSPVANRTAIGTLATNSDVNRTDDTKNDESATPNWSFVSNHDQQLDIINSIMIAQNPGDSNIMASTGNGQYNKAAEAKAISTFEADENSTTKQYAKYNIPSSYALELTNKDTIPEVYYGDLYDEFSTYMTNKSLYYTPITTLLQAREMYAAGGQQMTTDAATNIETSVRFGNGNNTATDTSAAGKTSGIAVVVGNNPDLAPTTVTVNMGADHANQQYTSVLNTTSTGTTTTATTLTTDSKGNLTVPVQGYSNPQVSGDLSVWVPAGAPSDQTAYTTPATTNLTGYTYQSNQALDSHVILEDFSEYEPGIGWGPGGSSSSAAVGNDPYTTLASNAKNLQQLGFTDIWMAPPYLSFSQARYMEGYAVADRYDLGQSQPTKYGNSTELESAIEAIHSAGMKADVDLVPNQMMGLDQQEAVTVNRTNGAGSTTGSDLLPYLGGTNNLTNKLYFAYTAGGGQYQSTYGGAFLGTLSTQYPSLFSTKDSEGSVLPANQPITQWAAKYENGTSLQFVGLGLAMQASGGSYDYVNGSGNTIHSTQLPTPLTSSYDPTPLTGLQKIDGNYYDFSSKGTLLYGQQTVNGKTYTFNTTTGILQNQAAITVKNVSLKVGAKWATSQALVLAMDASGNSLKLSDLKVTGTVNTAKAGTYKVTYSYTDPNLNTTVSQVATVTVGTATVEVPVYRLYNKNTGEHFYTESLIEKNSLVKVGWNYEGIGWEAPKTSSTPIYRVYNPNAKGGDHYYTKSKAEATSLVKLGWKWDNGGKAVFYSGGKKAVYVAYNPNAQSGAHNYTENLTEQNNLLKVGWKYGATAWYGE